MRSSGSGAKSRAKKVASDAREASLELGLGAQVRARRFGKWNSEPRNWPRQFEQRAQSTIEELSQKARTRIAKTKREYTEAVERDRACTGEERSRPKLRIEEGARVRLKGIRQPATVRRVLAGDLIEVDAGFLKMQVSAVGRRGNSARRRSREGPAISFQPGAEF